MASKVDVISTKDPEAIKKKRSNIRRMISTIHNSLAKMLEKTADRFDHAKILRARVLQDLAKLKEQQDNFDVIHEAYLFFRKESKDETEEETLLKRQDEYYNEVMNKICESLELGTEGCACT